MAPIPDPEHIPKTPLDFSAITYLWVLALSIWGGFVSMHSKIKKGLARPYNITEWLGEMATSAFVGLITFYGCEAANISQLITAIMVSISGHMGTRILFWLEVKLQEKAEKKLNDIFGE